MHRVQEAFGLGGERIDDVVEVVMFLEVGGDHRAHGDDAQPGVPGGGQCFGDQDAGQPAALERVLDLGVQKDPLAVVVDEGDQADLFAVDGDREPVGCLR